MTVGKTNGKENASNVPTTTTYTDSVVVMHGLVDHAVLFCDMASKLDFCMVIKRTIKQG